MLNDVTVFNIREYLSAKGDKDLGEDELRQLLSEFFCDKNPDEFLLQGPTKITFTQENTDEDEFLSDVLSDFHNKDFDEILLI